MTSRRWWILGSRTGIVVNGKVRRRSFCTGAYMGLLLRMRLVGGGGSGGGMKRLHMPIALRGVKTGKILANDFLPSQEKIVS